jgi:hypothetical protein
MPLGICYGIWTIEVPCLYRATKKLITKAENFPLESFGFVTGERGIR